MTIREFRLPDPGEGLVEADIVTWRVAVGDQVKINDIVVEIETSKSLVELPSPYAGVVTGLLVAEGEHGRRRLADHRHRRRGRRGARRRPREDLVPDACRKPRAGGRGRQPGRPGGGAGRLRAQDHRGQAAAAQGRAGRSRVGAGARHAAPAPSPPMRRCPAGPTSANRCTPDPDGASAAGPAPPLPGPGPAAPAADGHRRRPCWPSRRSASWPRISAIELSEVPGSGPGGVITRDDVLAERARRGWNRTSCRPSPSTGSAPARGAPAQGARDADPDQGGAQGDRPGHGAVGVHRAARQRVADLRRVGHHGAGGAAEVPPGVRRRPDLAVVDHRQGGLPGPAAGPRSSTRAGTRRPRRS